MFMTTIMTEFNVILETVEIHPRCDSPDLLIASEKFDSNIINIFDVVIVYGRC